MTLSLKVEITFYRTCRRASQHRQARGATEAESGFGARRIDRLTIRDNGRGSHRARSTPTHAAASD